MSRKSTIQLVETTTQRTIRVDSTTFSTLPVRLLVRFFLSVLQIDFPVSRTDYTTDDSSRIETSRHYLRRIESVWVYHTPCAFIRDLTSGKSSSAKRTSGDSEVFDPRADSNRLCFKTIRLSLSVLDMSECSFGL